MTMQNASHPLDELLSAYAAGDRDASSDRDLVRHVAGCDRCGAIVADLSLLRSALAELPDITPSRPLRLLPPVVEPARRSTSFWRRLTAPMIAAGAGLVLVGAIGSTGLAGRVSLFSAAGAAPEAQGSSNGKSEVAASSQPTAPEFGPGRGSPSGGSPGASSALDNGGTASQGGTPSESGTPAAAGSPSDGGELDNGGTPPMNEPVGGQPWSWLLIGGVALAGGGFAVRISTTDRDG